MTQPIAPQQYFSDAITRAVLAVEAGQGDTVELTLTFGGRSHVFTVWGAWNGDVFSWRMVLGTHDGRPPVSHGTEIFAGHGDDLDATLAAARVCWACAQMGAGEWSVSVK